MQKKHESWFLKSTKGSKIKFSLQHPAGKPIRRLHQGKEINQQKIKVVCISSFCVKIFISNSGEIIVFTKTMGFKKRRLWFHMLQWSRVSQAILPATSKEGLQEKNRGFKEGLISRPIILLSRSQNQPLEWEDRIKVICAPILEPLQALAIQHKLLLILETWS